MSEPAKKRATYQDVLDAPEHKVAEIINGVLHVSPRPGQPHTGVTSVLGFLLGPFHRRRGGPGGWLILDEPELHLGDDIVVPDLGGWRRSRMPTLTHDAFFTLAPDWICEALSPSTERLDRAEKLPIYAAAGVLHAWLVNARLQTLEVLRLERGKWLTVAVHHGDQTIRAEPFDAIEIELAELWADVAPLPPRGSRASEEAAEYEL